MKKVARILASCLLLAVVGFFGVQYYLSEYTEEGQVKKLFKQIRAYAYRGADGKEFPAQKLIARAIWCDDLELVTKLMEKGADLTLASPEDGLYPLHWAAASGRSEMILYVFPQNTDMNAKAKGGFSPEGTPALTAAAYYGYWGSAEALLERGADINGKPDKDNRTYPPLFAASFSGHTETVEFLLKQGANASYVSSDGHNALSMAASGLFGVTEKVAKLLVDKGADVNTVVHKGTSEEFTPLLAVAVAGNERAYEYLVSVGADENYRDPAGHTPREYFNGTAKARKVGNAEALIAAAGKGFFFDKIVFNVSFSGAEPCDVFLNGVYVAGVRKGSSGWSGKEADALFLPGNNTVDVVWYEHADGDPERRSVRARLYRSYFFGQGEDLMSQEIHPASGADTASFVFQRQRGTENFDTLLQRLETCNATPEEWEKNHAAMRAFAKELRSAGASDLVKKAEIAWKDSATATGTHPDLTKESFYEAARHIASGKPILELKDDDQLVFMPNCDGKLWRVGVMETPEAGRALMQKVAMLPRAGAKCDRELLSVRTGESARVEIPIYIGKIDGKFYIVRD